MLKHFLFRLVYFLFLFGFLLQYAQAQNNTGYWEIRFMNIQKKKVSLFCETAFTPKQQSKGLMFRKSLDKNAGMIFIYPSPRVMNFWMKNTQIPLSIAFINAEGVVTSIRDMKPLDESVISSRRKVLYAVEANHGWFKRNNIRPQSKIQIIPY